ncbi:MAG: threonine synthase, partial [Eubacteriales bacterium]
NNVLTEFFSTGVYDKQREFHITRSPSMDILISSNLERLLSLTFGDEKTREYMSRLSSEGKYALSPVELEKLTEKFIAGFSDDCETLETIRSVYEKYGYLMDTHTAVAWSVSEKSAKTGNKTVVLSTASPYKFAGSVLSSLGHTTDGDEFDMIEKLHSITGATVPAVLSSLRDADILHADKIKKEDMEKYVLSSAEAKT